MRNRLVSFLGMVLLLTGLLTGCDKSSAEAGAAADGAKKRAADEVIVTMPTTSEPESGFDPAYGWGAGEHVHEPLIQSTLTTTTKDLKIEKDLATDYQASPDGLTWTVTIRDDVAFTDGEPLTAEDVAFTYNHCKEKSTVNDFTMLDKAVAVDDKTVEFHMTRAFSIWPYTMAVVGIIPEHAYDENYGQNPVGSGRYIMKQWDKGQQVIFEANPDYYGEKPKIKKVTVLFMEEDAALAAAMAGKVDVAHTAASYSDQQIEGYSLLAVQTVDNRGFNLPSIEPQEKDGITYGNAFTADVNVRRAINIGIDREEMIENVLNGYGTQAYSVCDKMPWYNSQCEVDYDQEEARRLLTEAGWVEGKDGIREKDGKRAVFTLMFSTGDSVRQALAEDAANQLKEIGIEVKTEGVGWDVAYDRAQSEPLMWGWGAHTPMELYNIYHSLEGRGIGQAEYSPYSNGQVDQYMDQALSTGSLEDSYELWKKAQWDGTTGITQEGDIPWIWLCNIDHLYFVRDGLRVAEQKIHPHGHGWSIVNNVDQWSWETAE
ncbi:ABC transporter substrate-binding protein [[Clostridium] scindens]|uniref:ABC transporter substrate-binding protein n=1 Tax=Clostridium scindens (strain JCM 10418 / VPI 12708) TaxID=29347 RepID=UPI00156D71EA|nr:ABC transporter substrate-binding protein [[Clostridium] scindens]NSI90844.1 ABC transporter substrate-binding protein [[Clostridium] scindens]NSJ05464.1 ABC transporter substrate-binding protein [[Clostridium] scindens]